MTAGGCIVVLLAIGAIALLVRHLRRAFAPYELPSSDLAISHHIINSTSEGKSHR